MSIETAIEELDAISNNLLVDLVGASQEEVERLIGQGRSKRTTFQDFSAYNYLLEPQHIADPAPGSNSPVPSDPDDMLSGLWLEFDAFASTFIVDMQLAIKGIVQEGVTIWREVDDEYVRDVPFEDFVVANHFASILAQAHSAFKAGMAPDLFGQYKRTTQVDPYIAAAQFVISDWLAEQVLAMKQNDGAILLSDFYKIESISFWEAGVGVILTELERFVDMSEPGDDVGDDEFHSPFEPFRPNSINFGLQLSYRQSWEALGTSPGEIVRTLPLGPKQTEKISIKAITRRKTSRMTETITSIESATESSVVTKDSVEVINEVAEKNSYSVEANGSYGIGGFGASLKASTSGESSSSSKDTKTNLNESMEKTASRLKQDTKIVVSTETEETSEFSQVSEITNPNEELAVTYIYSRLQRQYRVSTILHEVNATLFVAERVPLPSEVNSDWIRRYDWIIAASLLDDSYAEDLSIISSSEEHHAEQEIDENVEALMESLSNPLGARPAGIPNYDKLQGEVPNFFEAQQLVYERELQRRREKQEAAARYDRALQRLRGHIIQNVLHYCRQIWQAEDKDIRMMRYSKIRVPINWEFVATGPLLNGYLPGYYAPVVYDYARDTVALSDLIHPVGPIGYVGNYAAFYLRQSDRWSKLLDMLAHAQTAYMRHVVTVRDPDDVRPAFLAEAVASDRRLGKGAYRVEFEGGSLTEGVFRIYREEPDGGFVFDREESAVDGALIFDSIKIRLSSDPPDGDVFYVDVSVVPVLEDPELKSIRWNTPNLTTEKAGQFFTQAKMREFAEQFTVIREMLARKPDFPSWGDLSGDEQSQFMGLFHAYLLRRRYSKSLSLDTNNVILTREMDTLSTLEPFKRCCQSNTNPSPASRGVGALIQPGAGAIRRGRRFSWI